MDDLARFNKLRWGFYIAPHIESGSLIVFLCFIFYYVYKRISSGYKSQDCNIDIYLYAQQKMKHNTIDDKIRYRCPIYKNSKHLCKIVYGVEIHKVLSNHIQIHDENYSIT